MKDVKAKSKSVSLVPQLWEQIETKAAATYGGNRSTYIRELIEQDLYNTTPVTTSCAPSIEKPILHLIRSNAPLIEHLYHKAYEVNGGPPENFDERLLLKCLLEQSLHLIAKHYEQDFRACTDIDLCSLIDQAKDFTTFQERARLATDYVRRPESIAAAEDHGVITQKDRQKAKTKYPPEFYPEYTPNAKPKPA